jgi:hypothetical protein
MFLSILDIAGSYYAIPRPLINARLSFNCRSPVSICRKKRKLNESFSAFICRISPSIHSRMDFTEFDKIHRSLLFYHIDRQNNRNFVLVHFRNLDEILTYIAEMLIVNPKARITAGFRNNV